MRHYETVLLVHPDQSDQLSDMLRRYEDLVTKNGGNVYRVEDIGRLQLAYNIDGMHKAHYVLMNFECNSQTLSEIKSSFEFNDSIMRHLVIRMNNAETSPSNLFLLHNKNTKQQIVEPGIKSNEKGLDKKDQTESTEVINQETNKDLDVKSEADLRVLDKEISATVQEEGDDEKV